MGAQGSSFSGGGSSPLCPPPNYGLSEEEAVAQGAALWGSK